jgi:hypothetical protein
MTFRGYGRRDRPAAEEGLGGPSSSSLFPGVSYLIPNLRPGVRDYSFSLSFHFINFEYSLVEPALFVNLNL